MYDMQKILDAKIIKEKGLQDMDRLPYLVLALQVELGECANEWRGFKYWSSRKSPKMLPQEECNYCEEQVDFTRPSPFMADYNANMCKQCWDMTKNEYAASNGEYIPAFEEYPHFPVKVPQKMRLFWTIGSFDDDHNEGDYMRICSQFLGLGEMLGFTWEQIEKAYMDKNAVNHERQSNGY
ncbi:dUTP diphosphatase [Paenibacillus sp. 2RAB27]